MARPKKDDRKSIRSERISLALTPTAYDGITALATIRDTTVNNLIGEFCELLVAQNADVIKRFVAERDKAAAQINLSPPTPTSNSGKLPPSRRTLERKGDSA